MINGYNFYFKDGSDVLTFPITPSELSIRVGSNNSTVTLINEGEINILKSPSLTEVEFDARFPMRQYPYARQFSKFENYWNVFKGLKENKKSFRFIVARTNPSGALTWETNLLMALEDMTIKESADEGDDVIISFKLKQYKEYGVKTIQLPVKEPDPPPTTSTSEQPRSDENKTKTVRTHTVGRGDCLWSLAKKYYGSGTKEKIIYEANKTLIEDTARKYGRKSSNNGWWIYDGTVLTIPEL